MNINQLCDVICKELEIKDFVKVDYVEDDSPSCNLKELKVNVVKREEWNEIYQLSHELLHISFFIHNNGKSYSTNTWIEEIVCEAFSIYCLEKYALYSLEKWRGYLYNDFYILNGNTKNIATVNSVSDLNEQLSGYKEYSVRQLIHPTALKVKRIIDRNYDAFFDFLDYNKFVVEGQLNGEKNEIAHVLSTFLINEICVNK